MGYTRNIIGEPLNKIAQNQLQARSNILRKEGSRQEIGKTGKVESTDLVFLSNNNCWVKMTSLIDIEESEILQKKFKGIGSIPAKNWVLFGGTKLETGNLKSGLESYSVGLENPLQELGYRPMPGIISATVSTLGTLGSLKAAEVVIKANTKEQLDALDILFFRLGFSCLLEWGHVMYLDSTDPASPKIQSFQSSDLVRAFDQSINKEKILQHLASTRKKTFGNYDGMLGLITNYSWSALEDGSYQCTVKLTGIGSVLDSLKINNNDFGEITPYAKNLIKKLDGLRDEESQIKIAADFTKFKNKERVESIDKEMTKLEQQKTNATKQEIEKLEKDLTVLRQEKFNLAKKIIYEIDEKKSKQLNAVSASGAPVVEKIENYKSIGKSNSNLAFGSTLEGFLNDLKIAFTEPAKSALASKKQIGNIVINQADPINSDMESFSQIIGDNYFNSIGLNLFPTDVKFSEKGQGTPGSLQHAFNYGFNSAILIDPERKDIPPVDFESLMRILVVNTSRNTDQSDTGPAFYIKLGALLAFINNAASLYCKDSTGERKPLVYIDFNPETNLCYNSKYQFSINPEICLVPYRLGISVYKDLFLINKIEDNDAQKLVDGEVNGTLYSDKQGGTLDFSPLNNYTPTEEKQQARLMEIDISIDYLLSVIRNSQGNSISSSVQLTQFLQTILADIQKSLGNVNNFRIGYNDEANCLTIYDDQIVKIKDVKTLSTAKPLPVYGLSSIAKGFSMNTETSTKLGSMLAITAQSPKTAKENSNTLNQDGSAFTQLNSHLKDRVIPVKTTSPKKETTSPVPDPNLLSNAAAIFNEYVRSYYFNVITHLTEDTSVKKIPTLNLQQRDAAINFYIGTLNKLKETALSQTTNGIKKSNITANGIMPISCNVKLAGLSTFTLYEGFTLPINRLPSQYVTGSNPSVGFVISGITHTIQNNNWDTDIKGAMINIPDYEVDESISISGFNFINPSLPITKNSIPITKNSIPITKNSIPTTVGCIGRNYNRIDDIKGQILSQQDDVIAIMIFIKDQEGYQEKAKYDVNAFRIGHGSDTITDPYNKVTRVTKDSVLPLKRSVGLEWADRDLRRRVETEFKPNTVKKLRAAGIDYNTLPLNVKIVFVDLSYNYGTVFQEFITPYKTNGIAGLAKALQNRANSGSVTSRRCAELDLLN